ncbi:tryptophan synthase subunit alpha [Aneurinibacillus tyrosinisolvens]|uniref:tryptophan synthase subunit alpha n=1 Tax=Aneurinibacillus tyrosinisolvens TaxID=1443435 RepID=UPI0009E1ED56|nr:tryptophan synthase subunit alpha [Aneurinibacillus tyrosinisolvens]
MKTTTGGTARIQSAFREGEQAFIPFLTAGYPSPELTVDIALALQEAGASILELGVPYSDPLADGPTIQRASAQALSHGVTIERVIELAAEMRTAGLHIPIILFTYFNPVLQYGIERIFQRMEDAQIDGILIPDLPFEESEEVQGIAERYDRPLISLVAPTSEQRIRTIASNARGFLYCVSSLGVTGARSSLDGNVTSFLEEVKRHASVPVAVGFGISSPEQAALIAPHSDGFIVGSALLEKIGEAQALLSDRQTKEQGLAIVKKFVMQLQTGV